MIKKAFEINKIDFEKEKFFLFYGENEGFKNEIIKNNIELNNKKNIYRYDEKEILDNKENFFSSIYSKSFF
jgi:DNA polymerase-3 subunit delta